MTEQGRVPQEPTTTAIILSRQPLRPCGQTPWVTKVVEAVSWIKQQNLILLSSVGMQTWELITAVGSTMNVHMRVYTGSPSCGERNATGLLSDFALSSETSIVPSSAESGGKQSEDMHIRDQAILADADLLIPISIRPNGYMSRALAEQEQLGKRIVRRFEIGHPARSRRLSYDLSRIKLNPELDRLSDRYLTHWTRATDSPWPDERQIDFYQSIFESVRYPRTAFDTLCHILETGTIKATSRHMPENAPTVSLTALLPQEVLPLMRWRARYTEMSFEPYGIGISMDRAEASGILPVAYYDKSHSLDLSAPAWLTQSIGIKSDWRQEMEYRHLGDISLKLTNSGDTIAFCLSPNEAQTIEGRYGIRALPLALD